MIRPNSVAAYRDLDTSERAALILGVYRSRLQPCTDREIGEALGFSDLNCVKPRISELVAAGKLMECPSVKDHVTGRTVRTCTSAVLERLS